MHLSTLQTPYIPCVALFRTPAERRQGIRLPSPNIYPFSASFSSFYPRNTGSHNTRMPSITIINDNDSFSSSSSTASRLVPSQSPTSASISASSSTVNIINPGNNHNHNHANTHHPPAPRKSALSNWVTRNVPRQVVRLVQRLRRRPSAREQDQPRESSPFDYDDKHEPEDEEEEEAAESYAAFCNAFTASMAAWDKESRSRGSGTSTSGARGCDKARTPTPTSSPLSTPLPLPPPGVITPSLHIVTAERKKKPALERGHKRGWDSVVRYDVFQWADTNKYN